jgi:uncharacterized protein (DUF2384 family)
MAPIELQQVVDRLAEFYTPAETQRWLESPHPLLGDERAIDPVNAGRANEVLAIVDTLDFAAYV